MSNGVLVIDMLKEFVHGKLGFEDAEKVVPHIGKLLKVAREMKVPIIYICDSHRPGDFELRVWGQHAMEGSPNSEVIDELKPMDEDKVIKKKTYSGFFETDLESFLKEMEINNLILTGVHTHICIQHTAADAFFRGYRVTIPVECVAGNPSEAHERSLKYMEKIYGARILHLSEVIEELRGKSLE